MTTKKIQKIAQKNKINLNHNYFLRLNLPPRAWRKKKKTG